MTTCDLAGRIARRLTLDPETGCWRCSGMTHRDFPSIWIDGHIRSVRVVLRERAGVASRRSAPCPVSGRRCVNPLHGLPLERTRRVRWFAPVNRAHAVVLKRKEASR